MSNATKSQKLMEYNLTQRIELFKQQTAAERAMALKAALWQTVEQVLTVAAVVEAMAQSNDDLSELPSWWVAWMRKIAAQDMLPEVFLEFNGTLREKVAALPVQQQKILAEGGTVELVVLKNGEVEIIHADPRKLELPQIRQIFGRSYIRDAAEQRSWLESKTFPKAQMPVSTEKDATACVVKKNYVLVLQNTRLTRKDLLMFLSQMDDQKHK
jgi:hypothetical protein